VRGGSRGGGTAAPVQRGRDEETAPREGRKRLRDGETEAWSGARRYEYVSLLEGINGLQGTN